MDATHKSAELPGHYCYFFNNSVLIRGGRTVPSAQPKQEDLDAMQHTQNGY